MKGTNFALSCDVFAQEIRPPWLSIVNRSLKLAFVSMTMKNIIVSKVSNLTIRHPSHYHLWKTEQQGPLAAKLDPNTYTFIPDFYQLFILARTLPSHHIAV